MGLKCFIHFLKYFQEFFVVLRNAGSQMIKQVDCSASSVRSGCDLFLQFITLQSSRLEEGVSKDYLTFHFRIPDIRYSLIDFR